MKDISIMFDEGDILIKRVANGWLVYEGCVESYVDKPEIFLSMKVFEDKTSESGSAESLRKLLLECFESHTRQNHSGGIEITFSKDGYKSIKKQ